ncbi:MAG: beta-N-acetylglucosaminidase domain-containing protein [Actinomycetales bacterium]|nr:beta-N-acetylglucosaminidase domain-containing protein [Actinomycetales bacterium]
MRSPFAIRGIIEGFYGRPWTHEQRRRAIGILGTCGMNTYLLSTKDEPWQRFDWRSALSDEVIAAIGDLVEAGRDASVEVGVSTSPGLTVAYSSPATIDAIIGRYRQLAAVGVSLLGLFLDDIPGTLQHASDRDRYADLCHAHIDLITRVHERLMEELPGSRLLVCPYAYWGFGTEDYITRLGQGLPRTISIMWTGRQICSAYLHSSDARVLAESIGRKPLYWDNYPVNDVAMTGELHIGPFQGRDADLGQWCEGLLANPMSAFESSLLPLRTVFDYLRDPTAYDPQASWDAALTWLLPDPMERAAFRLFARCSLDSCLSQSAAPDLESVLAQAMFDWRMGDADEAAADLLDLVEAIADAVEVLRRPDFSNQALQREIAPWVASFSLVGRCLSALAGHISAPDDPVAQTLLRVRAADLADDRMRFAGDAVQMTMDEIIALLETT